RTPQTRRYPCRPPACIGLRRPCPPGPAEERCRTPRSTPDACASSSCPSVLGVAALVNPAQARGKLTAAILLSISSHGRRQREADRVRPLFGEKVSAQPLRDALMPARNRCAPRST